MKAFLAILPAIALLTATPVVAQSEVLTPEQAEKRLRGCLIAGASGAPRTGLRAAVVAIRSVCHSQIKRVAANRRAEATKGLTGKAAKEAGDHSYRALNNEIAQAIQNFTGLSTL